jgi:hypothetical protein
MSTFHSFVCWYFVIGGISALVFLMASVVHGSVGLFAKRQQSSQTFLTWSIRTILGALYSWIAWPVVWFLLAESTLYILWMPRRK